MNAGYASGRLRRAPQCGFCFGKGNLGVDFVRLSRDHRRLRVHSIEVCLRRRRKGCGGCSLCNREIILGGNTPANMTMKGENVSLNGKLITLKSIVALAITIKSNARRIIAIAPSADSKVICAIRRTNGSVTKRLICDFPIQRKSRTGTTPQKTEMRGWIEHASRLHLLISCG